MSTGQEQDRPGCRCDDTEIMQRKLGPHSEPPPEGGPSKKEQTGPPGIRDVANTRVGEWHEEGQNNSATGDSRFDYRETKEKIGNRERDV